MVGVQSKHKKVPAARFSRAEIRHLEMLLQEGKDLLDPNFHEKLASEFNRPPGRAENKAIQVQQVQRWFLNRLKLHKVEAVTSKEMSPDGEEILPISVLHRSDFPEEIGEKISDVEMEFEAKSCRDQAWYDVSTFLAHKVLSSGEVEVRVRFDGFGPDEDEWVNVRKAVRERSVPMESSECWKLKEGDLLLCFREKDESANYFDAHVTGIERKMHDIRGCRCIFLMRYDHDENESIDINESKDIRSPSLPQGYILFLYMVDSELYESDVVMVSNCYQREFFLKSIFVEGFPSGAVCFICNSWMQSTEDHNINNLFTTKERVHLSRLCRRP